MSEFSEIPSEISDGGAPPLCAAAADELVQRRVRQAIAGAAGERGWDETREAWLAERSAARRARSAAARAGLEECR